MPFTFDFDGETVVEWSLTDDGAESTVVEGYRPTVYAAAPERALDDLAAALRPDPRVVATARERRYLDLDARSRESVLRIDLDRVDAARSFAHDVITDHERGEHAPGTYRLYNVDLPPEFRYCIETDTSPVPQGELETLRLWIGEKPLADGDVSAVEIADEPGSDGSVASERVAAAADEAATLEAVHAAVERADPDVLVVNRARLVPLCYERAAHHGLEGFDLGRGPGYERLAGENTFESYGQVGHSPARFNVPGRVLLNTSGSFLWGHSSLAGMRYLVERSWRPLQETGWASIGTVLTSMQIREAHSRDILVPWNKWEPEEFKDVRTLRAADRGGLTFEPEVGLHEDVAELDFASLYPNVILKYDISPETILCDCHPDRTTIPGLEYNVCEREGFLPDVLRPLIEKREECKRRIDETDDPEELADLESKSSAIKWILVTCFGYQGYRNAKWGRIECHEAINAAAREILLDSMAILEEGGWRLVHGIVDSLWVTPAPDRDQRPVDELCAEITEEIDITLEHDADYDWVAFLPRRDGAGGALNKYFGKVAGADEFKYRGIEARQRSTPTWIADAQRELIDVLDRRRSPEAVCERLKRFLGEVRRGEVPPEDLVVRKRVSKDLADYGRETLNVAALRRAEDHGLDLSPGQDVRYVVVDRDGRRQNRVRLHFEECDRYDADHYADLLVRACESVLSPLGWERERIHTYVRGVEDVGLSAFE